MPLSGVNRLCRQCTEKCKQWEQVTVYCPHYNAKLKKGATSTYSKTRRKPVDERSKKSDMGVL